MGLLLTAMHERPARDGGGNGGGGGEAPPDTTLATRKTALLTSAAAEANSSAYIGGAWATAKYLISSQSAGDASVDVILNALHPAQGGTYKSSDTFEPFWWCLPKLYGGGMLSGARDDRLRDVTVAYNTQASINGTNVLQSSGRTPNQYWMNQAAAIICWEQWGSEGFGSTGFHANHAGVEARYNFARDIFWPQYAEHVWKYGLQEIGIGYGGIYLTVSWVLKDKSTTPSVQKVGDFIWNQLVLQLSHLYGFDQIALPATRQHQHWSGTPAKPEALEMILWLLHGGTQYVIKRGGSGSYPLSETQYLVPLAASSGLASSAYSVARNIRHTASTHAPFEVKSAERRTLQEEGSGGRSAASPSYPYIYCTPKYQVGHFVWGSGTLSFMDRINNVSDHAIEYRQWEVTIKNTDDASVCNSLSVSADIDGANFAGIANRPATTPFEFTGGLEGTIVSAFNIEDATDPQWLNMAIPPVFTATAIAGNWWFGSAANCYVAVYFGRGFSLQAARSWYWNSDNGHSSMAWLRSPGSGSAAANTIVVETADPADYASFAAFQSAVLNTVRNGVAGGIGGNVDTPRITYADLKGNSFDVTYNGNIIVNGQTITTQHHNGTVSTPRHKRLDTPWVQLDYGGDIMDVTDPATGQVTRWRWSDKSVVPI